MVQERFVDAPAESVAMAHALLTAAMSDRGYPTADQDERAVTAVGRQCRRGGAIPSRRRDRAAWREN